ncbi:MAG: mechanosensitive ion channel family protein [Acidobacteriia bacterium]|nr:mechanosensitive ion channel family protein [Terriglobia bacterium]
MLLLGVVAPLGAGSGTSNPRDLIPYLNQVIEWYHQADAQHQMAAEPNDVITVTDNRRIADEVVRLAFNYARAEVEGAAPEGANGTPGSGVENSRYQSLMQYSSKLDKEAQQVQTELAALKQKLATASGSSRKDVESALAEEQSELDLANARRDMLHNMVEFVSGSSGNSLGVTGLRAQVEALAHSLPASLTEPPPAGKNTSSAPETFSPVPISVGNRIPPTGLWGLTADLFANFRNMRRLDQATEQTQALAQRSKEFRGPLVESLRDLSKRADEMASRPDSTDPTVLAQQKKDLDALTLQFKQVSAMALPLSKEGILLDLYSKSLSDWRQSFKSRYSSDLKNLLARLVFLAVILAAVLGAAELWRRTIMRYVHEARRRYQFLLLRKIVLWCAIAIIIAFSFANQLGSVATFAGLLTAGIAVALQSVILSVAGYFFLIGKYGIRVGDRVQISGVTGEVLDIGLVRLHLMEFGSGGAESPSGRVVAFSNSIVFQPTAGLFKQIPGTSFVWHEVMLTVSPDSDFRAVEKRMLNAVQAVYADYHDNMEQQRRQLERVLRFSPVDALQPKSRLRFTPGGVEVAIQYPVDLANAGEIDDRVTRELLNALGQKPRLNLVGSGAPTVVLKTDLAS